MDPLLFADHLRSMRESARNRPERRPAINLAGAGALVAAACAACLVVVTLQAAFSRPLAQFEEPARVALESEEGR